MSRGLNPNRQILGNWVNRLQKENEALKQETAAQATTEFLPLASRRGYPFPFRKIPFRSISANLALGVHEP